MRVTLSDALAKIGRRHPSARRQCMAILTEQLRHHARQDRTLNAFLISALPNLKPRDDLTSIKAAFAANNVDLSVQGN